MALEDTPMTRRQTCLACVVAVFGASLLFADQGIVKTKDGQVLQGEVEDKPDFVRVTIHGVQTTIPRSEVESVEMVGNAAADIRARVAKLGEQDAPGRVALAREAFDRREYELSREILES